MALFQLFDVCLSSHSVIFLLSLVSDELLQKSIGTMQGNLKKLEKELDTYQPLSDPEDKFLPVMKISFCTLLTYLLEICLTNQCG